MSGQEGAYEGPGDVPEWQAYLGAYEPETRQTEMVSSPQFSHDSRNCNTMWVLDLLA
jgi:hypothetical protein